VAADVLPSLPQQRIYCYTIYTEDYQLQRLGSLTLAVGQIRLVSDMTWETCHLIFTVLHLGGWDFHCCVQPFSGRLHYTTLKKSLFESLQQGSAAHTILTMNSLLRESHTFSLQDLCAEERHHIMRCLSEETLTRLNQLYSQVYRSNYGILMAFHRDGLDVPHELQVAAEVALSNRVLAVMHSLEQDMNHGSPRLSQTGHAYLVELEEIAPEVQQLDCHLNLPEAQNILERLILRALWQMLGNSSPLELESDLRYIKRLLAVGDKLQLCPSLAKVQELFYSYYQTMLEKPLQPCWFELAQLLQFSFSSSTS
jgi:alpha-amylase/alpha-mannosidase (GH57 family)